MIEHEQLDTTQQDFTCDNHCQLDYVLFICLTTVVFDTLHCIKFQYLN